ncbi:hypothetical protein [Oerskovia enterophila]|uniref:DUF4034 domain-containing protein n=1 Tax=Oerskovia enterophila TaxID=43678 RepID=A0ABX2Y8F5_9CELL|nr:hypothetical protein [Oerskovia enterophila]OCI31974.1 hypothetical protein OERS_13070 [Oerskovia enterophila]
MPRKRPSAAPPPVPPLFTTEETHPEIASMQAVAATEDWAAVAALLEELSPVDRDFALRYLSDVEGVEGLLERALEDDPRDPLLRTLLAERYVHIGWGIRSRYRAEHVSREQFAQFHDWLRRAEQILLEVCAEHPTFVLAWDVRLTTARGLELGHSEARRRYGRLASLDPHSYVAQKALLQQLCPKWSGSWEDAHGFATECAESAPAGAPNGAVVALAHIEHWLELDPPEKERYMASAAVRDDLRRAAARSVRHPEHREDFHSVGAHNAFALAFLLGDHAEDAAAHLRVIGNRASGAPWDYVDDPVTYFSYFRDAALAAG